MPMFDFNIGLGDDIIQTLNYCGFGDPIVALTTIFPIKYVDIIYSLGYILQVYLSGITFSLFCIYKKRSLRFILIGSYIYIFTGFTTNLSIQWVGFLNFLMLLPMILLGIEKVIQEKKSIIFIGTIAYAGFCSYYYLFAITVIGIIYALSILFVPLSEIKLRTITQCLCKFIKIYLIGIFLSAPILIPAIIGFLSSARTEKYIHFNLVLYTPKEILQRIIDFISPYSISALSVIALGISLFIVFILSQRKSEKSFWAFSIIILSVFFISPFGSYMITGFSYPSDRISYLFHFIIAYTSVYMLDQLFLYKKDFIFLIVLCSLILCLIVSIMGITNISTSYGIIILLLFSVIILLSQVRLGVKNSYIKKFFNMHFPVLGLLIIIVINSTLSSMYSWNNEFGNMKSWLSEQNSSYERINSSPIKSILPLYSTSTWNGRIDTFPRNITHNRGVALGLPGLTEYFSVMNKQLSIYGKELQVAENHWNHAIEGFDSRTYLNALASVKYLCINKNEMQSVPLGYKMIFEDENTYVYENEYALPLGITYDSYFTKQDIEPIYLQELMMQSVYIEDDIKSFGIPSEKSFTTNIKQIPYKFSESNINIYKDGILDISNDSNQITIEYDAPANSEVYLVFENFNISNTMIDDLPIGLVTSKNYSYVDILNKQSNYYYRGQDNFTVNLGYYENSKSDVCTMSIPYSGEFNVDNIKIYAQSMENYEEYINSLKDESLQNIYYTSNYIKGDINISSNKFLMFSIPYSKGWKVFVDGEETKIIKSNILYFGVELSKGEHTVELRYCTPGIKLGFILFGLGILLIVINAYKRSKYYKI